jgi:hypothetical protein
MLQTRRGGTEHSYGFLECLTSLGSVPAGKLSQRLQRDPYQPRRAKPPHVLELGKDQGAGFVEPTRRERDAGRITRDPR